MHTPLRLLLSALLLGLVAVGICPAQQLGTEKGLRAAYDGDKRLRGLMLGEEQAKKDDYKSAEIAANYYIYRVTHPKHPTKPHEPHDDLARQIAIMLEKNVTTGKPRQNQAFLNMFGFALIAAMNQVLDRDVEREPSTIVSAAMMLPVMAKLKQENVGDYLLEIIDVTESAKEKKYVKGKVHDIVRVYALKALRDYMPITPHDENTNFENIKLLQGILNDAKYVEGLSKYITRSIETKGLTSEEVEAVRFLRREAIGALAQAGAPAIVALKKPSPKLTMESIRVIGKANVQFEGPVAPTLLRVLAGDLPTLRPSLQEKLEAANGVCVMKAMPDYNADLGVYLVGRTLQEMISEYDKDWVNFTGKDKKVPMLPWKGEAKRLDTALAAMAAAQKTKSANDLQDAARPILISMTKYDITEAAKKQALAKLIQAPGDGSVFKTSKVPPIPLK